MGKPESDTESVEEDVVFESLQVELPDLDDEFPDILPLANSTAQAEHTEVRNHPGSPLGSSTEPTEVLYSELLRNFPVLSDGDNHDDEIFFGNIETENTTITNDTVTLKLHRGHVLEELEDYFMLNKDFNMRNTSLSIQMVLPDGELERAKDNGGVLRDALSEYWESFYLKRTSGNQLKVPALSHTVNGQRWEAVGKILCAGYYYEHFFPVQLASCFLEYAVTGDTVPKDILLAQFLKYLPASERKIAEMSLNNYEAVDEEDLLDFLSDHNVKVKPSKDNIKRILEETAHKELLQVPTYVADCWKLQLKELQKLLPTSFFEMQDMTPDFKRVWKMISYDTDSEIIGYLKKLLKEFTGGQLQKFLRFCTGADILIGKKIAVRLVESDNEFTRTPVAHVCGCVLEIPKSYSSFVELRNDFVSVLEASVWTMDFD